jgi:hypothetical protein
MEKDEERNKQSQTYTETKGFMECFDSLKPFAKQKRSSGGRGWEPEPKKPGSE